MRCVTASIDHLYSRRTAGSCLDTINLGQRPVWIVCTLDGQKWHADIWQKGFDGPMPEIRMKPDITPPPEGAVGIFSMISRQTRFQISVEVTIAGRLNGLPGEVFTENVGGQGTPFRPGLEPSPAYIRAMEPPSEWPMRK